MAEFAFQAVDHAGNRVAGSLAAEDIVQAAAQVRDMGYEPRHLEEAAPATEPTVEIEPVVAASGRIAPVDLTAPVADMQGTFDPEPVPVGAAMTSRMARMEPWERVGPLPPVPEPEPPVIAEIPRITAERAREMERDKPLRQRAVETLILPVFAGATLKDLAPFYRQFAALINAGLPLYQSLAALEASTKNARLKEIARAGMLRVQSGGRFSETMAEWPWIFSPMQVEMVRAAEQGGMLDSVLRQIGDYVEHDLEIRRLVGRETLYPKLVLFVAIMILGRSGFAGGQMAVVKLVLGGMGKDAYTAVDYFWDTLGFLLLVLGAIFGAVAIFRLFLFNVSGVRESCDRVKLSVPVVGKLIKMFAVARFARTFAALYRGGFATGSALEIAGSASGNAVLATAGRRAAERVNQGSTTSGALRESGLFDPLVLNMFQTGETSGGMDGMVDKVADYYEAEARAKSHQASIIFGVVVFLLLAMMIASQIFQQYGALGNGYQRELNNSD